MNAERTGLCVNYGLCELADRKTPIPYAPGDLKPVCPNDGKRLWIRSSEKHRPWLAPLAVIATVALIAASIFSFAWKQAHRDDAVAIATPQPAAAQKTAPRGGRAKAAAKPTRSASLVRDFEPAGLRIDFAPGSAELDTPALVTVGRLVAIVANDERERQVVLAGFADDLSDRAGNTALSRKRADAVAREVRAQGVRVQYAVGFGQDVPNRGGAGARGPRKNRYVEIFLTR